jgi:hypothetical protein
MAGSRVEAAEKWSLLDFAIETIKGRRGCTPDEAFGLLSDAAIGHDMSVSDLALCIVADQELR